jgi:hypothetical protein
MSHCGWLQQGFSSLLLGSSIRRGASTEEGNSDTKTSSRRSFGTLRSIDHSRIRLPGRQEFRQAENGGPGLIRFCAGLHPTQLLTFQTSFLTYSPCELFFYVFCRRDEWAEADGLINSDCRNFSMRQCTGGEMGTLSPSFAEYGAN